MRCRCVDFNKKQPPKQSMRLIRKIIEGWRTFTAVPHAPPKLNALLVQCLEVKPQDRPFFEQILSELSGPIKHEIDESNFDRQPLSSYNNASGLHGSSENSVSLNSDAIDSSESNGGFFDGANPADKTRLRAASLLQQRAVSSDSDKASLNYPRLETQEAEGRNEAGAEFMRNPILSSGARKTNDSRLSQQFSQYGRPSVVELSRVEVVTHTEV